MSAAELHATLTNGKGEGRRARAWVFAIALLSLIAWWPLSPYWQSDDFFAVTYASDLRRALDDFTGNQYAAPGMVWFYRPLITLSFALDAWLGGADPFVAHLSNALAHALSTLLVTLLGRRLLDQRSGLCLGLLWGLWPTHAGSILWAVGRVDSHTTVWILLSWWLTVRWLDGRRGRGLALATFVLALLSKELAFVVPGGVALLAVAVAQRGARLRSAWRATWPFVAVFAVYLAWRFCVLGRLVGGYEDARFSPLEAGAGLGQWAARVANPWLGVDGASDTVRLLGFMLWPLALGCALWRRRARAVVLLALGFGLCAIPTAPFWAETIEVRNVRYFYLPAVCMLGIVALGGVWPTVLALGLAAWPFAQVRQHYRSAHQQAARLHATLRQADRDLPPGPLLVSGLPRENAHHDVLMFHLFPDRLLLPPFGSGRRVLALRPLIERPGGLIVEAAACASFPGMHALAIESGSVSPIAAPPLPVFKVRAEGDLHLSSLAMWDLHLGRATQALHMLGDRAPHYRLTLLTAGGYLTCVLPNETPDQPDGSVSLKALIAQGRYATEGDNAAIVFGLAVPALFDVEAAFPLLIEAGTLQGDALDSFAPRARADRLLTLRLDRDYADWLAGRVDDPRKTN